MTTAQERRRARRIARRVAQESGPTAAEARVVPEHPVVRTEARPPEPPAPVAANGHQGWVVVKPATKPGPPARTATATKQPTRWVRVMAPNDSAIVAPPDVVDRDSERSPEPPASETLEPLPHEPGEETNGATARGPQIARALHPRTRAIRITRVKTNGKRRWSLDFLVRAPDMHLPSD